MSDQPDAPSPATAPPAPRSFLAFDYGTRRVGVASGNTLLSRFSMEDDVVFDLITQHAKPAANGSALRQAA